MSNYTYSPSLLTLPIDSRLINVLRAYKLTCLRDIEQLTEEELSKEVHITREEAASIVSAVEQIKDTASVKQRIKVTSLLEIFEGKERVPHQLRVAGNEWSRIYTNCSKLDAWLGGGIALASLTEFYGKAGIGKTQFCLQLCVNVQKPRTLGGVQGEALFIDGESCLRPERLIQMANGALAVWQAEASTKNIQRTSMIDDTQVDSLSAESLLEHIHYLKILNPRVMAYAILDPSHLDNFLDQHRNIRLIVLDGFSYQFRYNSIDYFDSYRERDDIIQQITHKLRFLAHSRDISFVITNQITSNLDTNVEKPALGPIWSRSCSTKLEFNQGLKPGTRQVTLVKSQFKSRRTFAYRVLSEGISDAEDTLNDDLDTQ